MLKKYLIAVALSFLSSGAFAACTNPLSIKDGTGAAISMSMSSNADGFCQYNFNMAQINGVAPLMGAGATGTGSPRVTAASDSPEVSGIGATADTAATVGSVGSMNAKLRLMTSQLDTLNTTATGSIPAGAAIIGKVGIDQTTPGTTNLVALAANQSVNVTQINSVTPLMGLGASGTGSSRVTTASDSPEIALITSTNTKLDTLATNTAAAIPTGSNSIGSVGFDPSKGGAAPASVAINVSTATTTQLVALSGSTVIYVTSYDVLAGGTGNITFVYGTGSSCGTGTTSLTGAYPLIAQAGIAKGSGVAMVLKVPAGNALCVTTSAAVQMSGSISYQQF